MEESYVTLHCHHYGKFCYPAPGKHLFPQLQKKNNPQKNPSTQHSFLSPEKLTSIKKEKQNKTKNHKKQTNKKLYPAFFSQP